MTSITSSIKPGELNGWFCGNCRVPVPSPKTFDIPEGFALVPIEPTPEMIKAACQDGVSVEGRPVWKHSTDFQAKWKYQQMINAFKEVK